MANTQVVNKASLYVDRLVLAWASNTTLTGGIGAARDSTNVYDIEIDAPITINAAINGANGLDTGSLANSTYYAVYVIGDSTNTLPGAYLLSTSSSAPSLPFGYDVFRRVGWVLTNGSAQFLLFYQEGKDSHRRYFWDALIGTSLNAGSTTFVAVSLAVGVPPTGTSGILNWSLVPNAAGNEMSFRRTGSSSATPYFVSGPTASNEASGQIIVPCNTSQSINVKTTSASDVPSLFVAGFDDYL